MDPGVRPRGPRPGRHLLRDALSDTFRTAGPPLLDAGDVHPCIRRHQYRGRGGARPDLRGHSTSTMSRRERRCPVVRTRGRLRKAAETRAVVRPDVVARTGAATSAAAAARLVLTALTALTLVLAVAGPAAASPAASRT